MCALAGAVSALNVMGTTSQTDANMGETLTGVSYEVDSLTDIQTSIDDWWSIKASPFIVDHRDLVYEAAVAEAEEKYGALLETCDEGTACRDTIMSELKDVIYEIW